MADIFLTLEGVTVTLGGARLLDQLNWIIRRGEQWAVVGPSGSGKTTLAHTLLGQHFSTGRILPEGRRITMVEQQHRFRGRPGATDLYYQQRFNSADADATITVAGELAAAGVSTGPDVVHPYVSRDPAEWLDWLHVRPLLSTPLIQLSNGENKRVQLAIALSDQPDLLILDNPFLGLDIEGRAMLHSIIDRLAAGGMQILLITGEREIPACITHIGRLEKGKWSFLGSAKEFLPVVSMNTVHLDHSILDRLRRTDPGVTDLVIVMRAVTIRYGQATILDNIDWEVRKGERWNVSGPNGAGKSTLLSLVTADNPQAYANQIWLFGRRRGTGESIWEIKQKIGFVSPELHLYFDPGATCFQVVASGLYDTIGLFRQLMPEQEATVMLWLQLLSLQDLRMKQLRQMSVGQQRMVLLARALIKNPPLLVLDEPCQGLDDEQTAYFRELVAVLCETFDTTLIYVSHYRQELPRCIDKYLRLEQGKRVE
ncbi:MAG TPA: ATP-binding cassette domain-containing protein [Puia sp.]|nr:ATP-binding cassette domain-containing protein [Puia sp.]